MTILAATCPPPSLPVAVKSTPPPDSWLSGSKVPQGHTDELLTWLAKVHQKKAAIRSTRARDLRKEAVLEAARVAAQSELESKQRERRERWRDVRSAVTTPPQTSERDETLCDCESCFLCQRHRPSMYGKCYCNVIFSPRPIFMDFSAPVAASEAFAGDEEVSREADSFLASLGSKRKCSDGEELAAAAAVQLKRAKA